MWMWGELYSLSMVQEHMVELLSLDYFSLFCVSASYSIDQDSLKAKYLDLQKQFHPDNFVANSDVLKRLSIELSAHINTAYKTLKSPLLRGIAFLSYYSIKLDLTKDTELPNTFLFEQMEFHDKIESASNEGGDDELEKIELEIIEAQSNLIVKITDYCSHGEYIQVKELLKQLAFYERLRGCVQCKIEHR